MSISSYILSSAEKVFIDFLPEGKELSQSSTLKNEPYSFQLAYKSDDYRAPFYPEIVGDYPLDSISVYSVGNVPILCSYAYQPDDCMEDRGPGLYPDMLIKRNTKSNIVDDGFWTSRYFEENEKTLLFALTDVWQSLWFTLNESSNVAAGDYSIIIRLRSQKNNEILSENKLQIKVIDEELPEQTEYYTNWFHCDCLADYYGVEMFSERHFEIIKNYLKNAALHGMNTVLLPAFTPEIDTPVGKERKTAQLVKISKDNKGYSFDFSLMRRFINMALECGIKYFEHAHFFTQWGAKFTPKIVVNVNGEEKKLFGWHTESKSEEYIEFLESYIQALKGFLAEEKLEDKMFFHFSDEPCTEELIESYTSVAEKVKHIFEGLDIKETFNSYDMFSRTYVKTPIATINTLLEFTDKCEDLWVYYTGECGYGNYTNRMISQPNTRCRVLGMQMYYYGIKGFLHWGYNFYYSVLSHGLVDPAKNPCAMENHPGTAFIVYPEANGNAIPSIREKMMMEAFCDLRALKLLESKIGREKVKKLCNDWFGDNILQLDKEKTYSIIKFRETVNDMINETLI